MTATDVLRRLLDERGVEWHDTKIGKGFITVYEHDCITWIVTEHLSGRLSVKGCIKPTQGHYDGMTPEQAIAATLGVTDAKPTQAESSGTCRIEYHYGEWYCTSCGEMVGTCDPESELCVDGNYVSMWNYCPNCGRRVEQ